MTSSSKPDWHALFAPLPADAVVKRQSLPEMKDWEQLSVELSAGADGLRHLLVVLEAGKPISAGDWVMYCSGRPLQYVHENVGGRIQPDGSFLGTRWRTVAVEVPGQEEPEQKEMVKSDPTDEDVAGIRRMVQALLERAKS